MSEWFALESRLKRAEFLRIKSFRCDGGFVGVQGGAHGCEDDGATFVDRDGELIADFDAREMAGALLFARIEPAAGRQNSQATTP